MQTATKMDGENYICDSIELEMPWTSYRKFLLYFTELLRIKEREKAFKLFCLPSIPTKNWDNDIAEWLMKLEQSNRLSINQLDILCSFLEPYNDLLDNDAGKIWAEIRKFKYRLKFVRMLLGGWSDDDWMYSRRHKKEVFEISEDLDDLLKQWRQRIKEAPYLSWPMISKIYSQATQRIAKVASENHDQQQDERSPSLEALFIAQFLMDIEEIAAWLTSNTSSEHDMEKQIKKSCKLHVEDYITAYI